MEAVKPDDKKLRAKQRREAKKQFLALKALLASIYKYPKATQQIENEVGEILYVSRIEVDNGVLLYIDGMEYPNRSHAPTEDVASANIAKKMAIEGVRIIKLLPRLLIKPVDTLDKILNSFNFIAFKAMSDHIWKDELLAPSAKELMKFINIFLVKFGVSQETAERTAEIFANIINIDDAYRLRMIDLFNESSPEQFKKPRKEIRRLINLCIDRQEETAHLKTKLSLIAWIATSILLIPKAKRAFIEAINMVDYNKLKPDTIDWFAMCTRNNNRYHFLGKTNQERAMLVNHLKVVKPTKKK